MTTPSPARFALMNDVRTRTLKLLQSRGWKGWTVTFDRALTRAGQCRYPKKEICFSILFLENADAAAVENTIIHEVSHAFAGPLAGHGPQWASICEGLGGRPSSHTVIPTGLATHENFPWLGTCPACGYCTGLSEAPQDVWLCSACPKTVDKRTRIFSWSRNGERVAPLQIGGNYSEEYSRAFPLVAA